MSAPTPAPNKPAPPPFRLAIRNVDGRLVGLFAKLDTLEGARELGSIDARLCELDPKLVEAFQALMTLAYTRVIERMAGRRVTAVNVTQGVADDRGELAPPDERRIIVPGAQGSA